MRMMGRMRRVGVDKGIFESSVRKLLKLVKIILEAFRTKIQFDVIFQQRTKLDVQLLALSNRPLDNLLKPLRHCLLSLPELD